MTNRPNRFRQFLLLLLILLLAACQANPTEPVGTAQPTGAASTPPTEQEPLPPTFTPEPSPTATPSGAAGLDPAALDGVEIHFWHPWMDGLAAEAEAMTSEFNRSNEWGITVHHRGFTTSGELYDAVTAALEEDPTAAPDVVAAATDQIASWDADHQAVASLDDLIASTSAGLTGPERDAYFPVFWEQEQQGGRQLAIPFLRSAQVLFYNQTWANELGFATPPITPDDFKEQSCAAAVANNASNRAERVGTGGWLVDTDSLTFLSWIGAFGGTVLAPEEDPPYAFRTDEAEDALAFLRGLMEDGCAWLPRTQNRHEVFARRLALFVTGSLSDITIQRQVSSRVGGGDQWIVLPFPSAQGEPQVWSAGYSLAVLSTSGDEEERAHEEQLAAWLFVRWLSHPERTASFAQKLPSLPVSSDVAELVDADPDYPAAMIEPLNEAAQPAPGLASWRLVRRLVSDAAWQVFYLPSDQIEFVLPQLEDTARELLRREEP